MLLGRLDQLHGDKLESLLFESLDDFANESSLDAIRLDHDVSLTGHFGLVWLRCESMREDK